MTFQKPSSIDFEIAITDFRGSYVWGLGDRDHFLNNLELRIQGIISEGPMRKGKSAFIHFETAAGEEPNSYDKKWFNDAVAIGRVEVGHNLNVHAVVARSGIQSMLQLLNTTKEIKLFITCLPLEEDSLGGQNNNLLRIHME